MEATVLINLMSVCGTHVEQHRLFAGRDFGIPVRFLPLLTAGFANASGVFPSVETRLLATA